MAVATAEQIVEQAQLVVTTKTDRVQKVADADMGDRPGDEYSIERIDNNGDYSPDNCCWLLKKHQARNRRTTRWITANGERLSLAEWAERLGVHRTCIERRLADGWFPEDAVRLPPRRGLAHDPS